MIEKIVRLSCDACRVAYPADSSGAGQGPPLGVYEDVIRRAAAAAGWRRIKAMNSDAEGDYCANCAAIIERGRRQREARPV